MRSLALVVVTWGCGRVDFDSVEPALACPTDALYCDGFESGDVSRWSDVVQTGPSSLAVEAGRGHTGTYALAARMAPFTEAGNAYVFRLIAPRTTGLLAVRQWVQLESTLEKFSLVTELRVGDNFTTVGGAADATWASTEIREGQGSVTDRLGTVPTPPIGRWVCVELDFDYAAGNVAVLVDGTTVLGYTALRPLPAYDEVRVGATRAAEIGFGVLVDDVVIADHVIGCD